MLLLDDAALPWLASARSRERTALAALRAGRPWRSSSACVSLADLHFDAAASSCPGRGPSPFSTAAVAPFRSINGYGLFAVMTTSRPEIVVEGSDDGASWQAYGFR